MILLDTHVLIWFLTDHPNLPSSVKERIRTASQVFVSAATIWELGIKARIKGKGVAIRGANVNTQSALNRLISECSSLGFQILPISVEACTVAPFLPGNHKDPFDRMIAAQSLGPEKLVIISADQVFDSFGPEVTRDWSDGTRPLLPAKRKPPRKA